MEQQLSSNLRFTGGGSDKVYQCEVVPDGQGMFNVNFNYGRYGSTLRPGTKNKAPLSYEKAAALYEKIVKEKLSEGYREVGGETAQFTQSEKKHSGIYPMLLTPITEELVPSYLERPGWWMQEKHDGERLLVRKKLATITGINKKGEERPIPAELAAEIVRIDGDLILDGELVGDTYWVFDLLERMQTDLRLREYGIRYELLRSALTYPSAPPSGLKKIKLVIARQDPEEKRQFFFELRGRKAEGMVFIAEMSSYSAGRGTNRLKFKFTESATCLVKRRNGDKNSVYLQLRGENGLVDVGKVTIPANFTPPSAGDLVEVRYLYAYPGGCLFQSVYLGPREDQSEPDLYSSLKFKAGTEEDEG